MAMELERVEIQGSISIPFDWIDRTPGGSNLGRAEFAVCIKYRRRKMVEYFVTPQQQRNQKYYWHWNGSGLSFTVSSYENLDIPSVWMHGYCAEHKTPFFRVYAPDHARYLYLDHNGLGFTQTDWNAK